MNHSPSSGDKNPEGGPAVEVRPRNDNSNPQQGTGGGVGRGLGTSKGIEKAKVLGKVMVTEKDMTLHSKIMPSVSPVPSDNEIASSDSVSVTNIKTSSHNKTQLIKKDSRKLFVGGLPADVTDREFSEFFGQFGVVLDSVVMYDRETHRSRGFGFVTFQDPDVATRLLGMGQGLDQRSNEDKKSHPNGPMSQHQAKVGRLEMRGKICEVKAAEPKESRLSRSRPQLLGQSVMGVGSPHLKNTGGNNSNSSLRHSTDAYGYSHTHTLTHPHQHPHPNANRHPNANPHSYAHSHPHTHTHPHSHRSGKFFVDLDESVSVVPNVNGSMAPFSSAGLLASNGTPMGFSYAPHYNSHDVNGGLVGPHGQVGPSSYYHPSVHGMHPNNVGHYMGAPIYNHVMFPFHQGGEMAAVHNHNGVFMVPPPVFGTHIADGFGMYMDGSALEVHQHFPPHHNPYWNMMHHQHHHLQVHHHVIPPHHPSHALTHSVPHRQHSQPPQQQPTHSNNKTTNNVPYHSASTATSQSSGVHRHLPADKSPTKETKKEDVNSSV